MDRDPTESSPVLSYGRPDSVYRQRPPWLVRLWHWLPKPSPRTMLLLLPALATGIWLWYDNAPWVHTATLDEAPAANGLAAAISPDELFMVAISSDGYDSATIIDLKTLRPIGRLEGHEGNIWAIHISPDSQRVITIEGDRERSDHSETAVVRLWDPYRQLCLAAIPIAPVGVRLYEYGSLLPFSPGGDLLAVPAVDGVALLDSLTGQPVRELTAPRELEQLVVALRFSADGQSLAGFHGGTPVIWSIDGTLARTVDGVWLTGSWVSALSPDGKILAYRGVERFGEIGSIYFVDTSSGRVRSLRTRDQIRQIGFSRDGEHLAVRTMTGLRLWETADLSEVAPRREVPKLMVRSGGRPSSTFSTLDVYDPFDLWSSSPQAVIATLDRSTNASQYSRESFVRLRDGRLLLSSPAFYYYGAISRTDAYTHILAQRRPDAIYGLAWLPQFWLFVLAAGALAVSTGRDLRRWATVPSRSER
jgi:hypothetical protein